MSVQERNARFAAAHDKYSPRVRNAALAIRGFYLKSAQMMSTREDFVPPQYLEWCEKIQNEAPVLLKANTAKQIVHDALVPHGKEFSDVFSEWQKEPIGCASIGQVYKARLVSGEEVAVKVQRPGVEKEFRLDLKTLIFFTQYAMPWCVKQLEEIEHQFETEFDYTLEATNLRQSYDNSRDWSDRIVIPRPFEQHTTKNVLTMELLHGRKFIDVIETRWRRIGDRFGMSEEETSVDTEQIVQTGRDTPTTSKSEVDDSSTPEVVKKKRTFPKMTLKLRLQLFLAFLTDYFSNSLKWLSNKLFGTLYEYDWLEWPLDVYTVLTTFLSYQGHQIFMKGAFNGDPHPGNLLILDNGKLGVVDYGQVKQVDDEFRVTFAKLMLAFARNDREGVIEMNHELGMRSKYEDPHVRYAFSRFAWEADDGECEKQGLYNFLVWCDKHDPITVYPHTFYHASRSVMVLRGVGLAFGYQLKVSDYFKQWAEKFLQEKGIKVETN